MRHLFYMPTPDYMLDVAKTPVIAVAGFERGYHPIHTSAAPEALNHGRWTPQEIESAFAASMFGWNCPAAQDARKAIERLEAAPV